MHLCYRNLLVDYLNEMKQNLTKKTELATGISVAPSTQIVQDSSSLIFKLFSDLEQMDLDRTNKANIF